MTAHIDVLKICKFYAQILFSGVRSNVIQAKGDKVAALLVNVGNGLCNCKDIVLNCAKVAFDMHETAR